jgi:hypothetical protein
MPATFSSRAASAARGEQVLELTDLSPILDDSGFTHRWDYKVAVGPAQGQPVQLIVPPTPEAHRQMVKLHFERGYLGKGGSTHRKDLIGRRVVANIGSTATTLRRHESDQDAGRPDRAEVFPDRAKARSIKRFAQEAAAAAAR